MGEEEQEQDDYGTPVKILWRAGMTDRNAPDDHS